MTSLNSKTTITKTVPRQPTKVITVVQRKSRPRRRRGRAARQVVSRPRVAMADCSVDYASALLNPFGYNGPLPCIPDTRILPSNKIKCICTGTVYTSNTTGVGYVILNPQTGCWNNNANFNALTDFPILYTDPNYANSGVTYAVAAGAITTPGVFGANSNSPYAQNTLWETRPVAVGLKVQYSGNELYKQGSVHLYREPDNNINSGRTITEIMADNYTRRLPVSRAEQYLYFTPLSAHFTDYHNPSATLPSSTGFQTFAMGIIISGGAIGNAQPWLFEAVFYYEIIGRGLPLSPSHSDPVGYGAVQSSLPLKAPGGNPTGVLQSVLNGAVSAIRDQMTHVVNTAVMPRMTNVATNAGAYMANRAIQGVANLF